MTGELREREGERARESEGERERVIMDNLTTADLIKLLKLMN